MFAAIRDRTVVAHAGSIPALKDAVLDALGDDACNGEFKIVQLLDEDFRFGWRLVCVRNLDE